MVGTRSGKVKKSAVETAGQRASRSAANTNVKSPPRLQREDAADWIDANDSNGGPRPQGRKRSRAGDQGSDGNDNEDNAPDPAPAKRRQPGRPAKRVSNDAEGPGPATAAYKSEAKMLEEEQEAELYSLRKMVEDQARKIDEQNEQLHGNGSAKGKESQSKRAQTDAERVQAGIAAMMEGNRIPAARTGREARKQLEDEAKGLLAAQSNPVDLVPITPITAEEFHRRSIGKATPQPKGADWYVARTCDLCGRHAVSDEDHARHMASRHPGAGARTGPGTGLPRDPYLLAVSNVMQNGNWKGAKTQPRLKVNPVADDSLAQQRPRVQPQPPVPAQPVRRQKPIPQLPPEDPAPLPQAARPRRRPDPLQDPTYLKIRKEAKKAAIEAGTWAGSPDSDGHEFLPVQITAPPPQYSSPAQPLTLFTIYRLIPYSNKNGEMAAVPEDVAPRLQGLKFGDFFLSESENPQPKRRGWERVLRGMDGNVCIIPARMLQRIHHPWGIPQNVLMDDEGEHISIAVVERDLTVEEGGGTVFLQGEYVLCRTPRGDATQGKVVDFEGRVGTVDAQDLDFPREIRRPWGVKMERSGWRRLLKTILGKEPRVPAPRPQSPPEPEADDDIEVVEAVEVVDLADGDQGVHMRGGRPYLSEVSSESDQMMSDEGHLTPLRTQPVSINSDDEREDSPTRHMDESGDSDAPPTTSDEEFIEGDESSVDHTFDEMDQSPEKTASRTESEESLGELEEDEIEGLMEDIELTPREGNYENIVWY